MKNVINAMSRRLGAGRRAAFCLLLLGFGASALPAQVTQADSAAVLLGVASRLRAEGRTALANTLLDLIRERYASTPAAVEAARLRAEAGADAPEERSGKTELLVWSTMYGLAIGSLAPVAFGVDEPEVVGIGLIAGGPTGFLLGRQIVKRRPISEGQARAISFGSLWGAWQGLGWAHVLDLGEDEYCGPDYCYPTDPDGETVLRSALLGSVLGLGTGLYLARNPIPAGTATTVNFGALWGTWYGVALNELIGSEGVDDDANLTWALIGGDAGLLATALLAPRWKLSRGRARLISISGVAGLLAGAGLLLITQPDGDGSILMPMLGSAAGLGLGVHWTRNYDERTQAGGSPGDAGALLDFSAGSLRLGTPELSLRALETRRQGRPSYRPGVYLPLVRAAF